MFMALVLGLVSCQNEPDEMNVSLGGEQEVMLTVSLPEATRADSADGALDNDVLTDYDLRYILEVYYGENCNRFVQTSTSTSAVFPVRLAPGRTYTFVVWADFVTKGANAENDIDLFYETSNGLKEIQIIEDKWAPMVEARDAYFFSKTIDDFQTSSNLEMTLTRPFAKVRVVSTDIEQLRGVGIVPTTAQATYSQNMYRKFNAATGVASEAATKTHTFAYANVDSYEANTDSKLTIFSDYIFVPAEGVAKFTLEVWDGETPARYIKQNNFNTDIFVEKNKVTSIVGDVLTTGGNVKVTIDGELGEKETITIVDNAQSLQDAINNAPAGEETTIELGGNIDLGSLTAGLLSVTRAGEPAYALLVDAGKEVALDLKGFTISYEKTQTANFSMIQNDGKLTIVDSSETKTGKIVYTDKGQGGNYISNTITNRGTLIVKGGKIDNDSSDAVADTGFPYAIDTSIWGEASEVVVNIEGGTIESIYSPLRVRADSQTEQVTANISGGVINGRIDHQMSSSKAGVLGALNITGGEFNPFGVTDNTIMIFGAGVDTDASGITVAISGGEFNAPIKVYRGAGVPIGSNFNDKFITGGTFSEDPLEFVNDDYTVVETENGLWTVVRKPDVVKIGEVGYTSLAKAVAAAQNGDIITFVADVEQVDGVLITDKNITIDLNDKTFTVSNGANTNNRNFKVNGSSVVTIKNGTMVAAGDYTSGAYGTVRTEDTANVTLESVILRNYRGNGLNVKALSGTNVTIKDTEIYSEYGGGIESAGGIIELTNVKVEQKGMYTAPYNSMAISVNGGGTVTVNSGTYSTECITAEEAYNQGTSHGPWCAGVLNSGGTLIIKGGTFSNDNYGDNTLATAARGLLLADTGANIQIEGGTFNAVKSIIDIQNNLGDASKNPSATISGGNFSANPLTWDGLIKVAAGYKVVEENGVWTVKMTEETKLRKVLAEGGEVTLEEDITIAAQLEVTTTEAIVVNGNNKTINYTGSDRAFNVNGLDTANVTLNDLTFVNDASYCQRGINFNVAGKLTLNNVTVGKTGTPATYAINLPGSSVGAEVVINNSYFRGNIALNVWGENAKIKATGSEFVSYDGTEVENYAAISLNNDGSTIANGTTIDIDGGKVIARDEKGEPSYAVRNSTNTGEVTISDSTEVVGTVSNPVAAVIYEGYNEFYSCTTLKAAIDKAIETKGSVRLIKDIEVDETITIPAEGNVTLDLNGHNITSNIAGKPSESFALFSVNGNLEIKGNGTISLTSEDFEWNTSYRYTAINIRETGVVTLGNGVSVICEASKDGSYGMSYAVDIYTTGTLNINGASLHSNYIAVRCFYGNSVVYVNSGSKITSSRNNYGIWLQSSPGAVVTIADGVNYTFENNIYCFN